MPDSARSLRGAKRQQLLGGHEKRDRGDPDDVHHAGHEQQRHQRPAAADADDPLSYAAREVRCESRAGSLIAHALVGMAEAKAGALERGQLVDADPRYDEHRERGAAPGSIIAVIMTLHITTSAIGLAGSRISGMPGIDAGIPAPLSRYHHASTTAITGIANRSGRILVVAPHPPLRTVTLVAPLGRHVDEVVGAVHDVDAACVRRVRVEHHAVRIFVEDADALAFGVGRILQLVVVERPSVLDLFFGERDAEVAVEVGLERGEPLEAPPMRFSYAASFANGTREIATNAVSCARRCGQIPLKLSAQNEQCWQPSSSVASAAPRPTDPPRP